MSEPPSWWKYIGGRDADRLWARAFVGALRAGHELSQEDRTFYLTAVDRLADDEYPISIGRPEDRANFWVSCHYWLGTMTDTKKAAALRTAALIATDYKAIQRKANELHEPVRDFLSRIVGLLPAESADVCRQHARLMEWIEAQVQKVD